MKTYSVGSFLFMTSMHEKELKLQATKKRVDFKANEKRNEQEKKRPATLQSKSEVRWDEAVLEAPRSQTHLERVLQKFQGPQLQAQDGEEIQQTSW
jgi:hypothetical protein